MANAAYNNFKSVTGFTLVEMLITIAILSILSGVLITNFRQGENSSKLKQASLALVQDLRSAQSYSLAGKIVKRCANSLATACSLDAQCSPDLCSDVVPVGGFGINIASETLYNLFTDMNESGPLAPSRTYNAADGSAIIAENMLLRYATRFGEYQFDSNPANSAFSSSIDITFEPPTGRAHFCVGVATCVGNPTAYDQYNALSLLIKSDTTTACRRVTINRISGQIGEQLDADCNLNTPG